MRSWRAKEGEKSVFVGKGPPNDRGQKIRSARDSSLAPPLDSTNNVLFLIGISVSTRSSRNCVGSLARSGFPAGFWLPKRMGVSKKKKRCPYHAQSTNLALELDEKQRWGNNERTYHPREWKP
jgi:hypothetical protein